MICPPDGLGLFEELELDGDDYYYVEVIDPADPYPWERWLEVWGGSTYDIAIKMFNHYLEWGFPVKLWADDYLLEMEYPNV